MSRLRAAGWSAAAGRAARSLARSVHDNMNHTFSDHCCITYLSVGMARHSAWHAMARQAAAQMCARRAGGHNGRPRAPSAPARMYPCVTYRARKRAQPNLQLPNDQGSLGTACLHLVIILAEGADFYKESGTTRVAQLFVSHCFCSARPQREGAAAAAAQWRGIHDLRGCCRMHLLRAEGASCEWLCLRDLILQRWAL